MLIASLWKWLFAWEQQIQSSPSDANADQIVKWRLYQREFHIFGYPHFWG